MTNRLTGVVTPLLTPYEDDGRIAEDLYLAHAAECLEGGSHYLSPFGTTGEATSQTVQERIVMLERLVSSGIAKAEQLMPGTGLCNIADTVTLTRHAAQMDCAAAMVLPPFFYPPSDEGLYRYYSQLIEMLGSDAPRIILYNIPQNTGVPLSPDLSARLNTAFPELVVAYKDSSGDWENTAAVIRTAPGISVFPASETLLDKAMALGAGGCISASCNSNVRAIRRMYDLIGANDRPAMEALQPALEKHRLAVQKAGLIGGLKSLKAFQSGDKRWLNLRAPHVPAPEEIGSVLAQSL